MLIQSSFWCSFIIFLAICYTSCAFKFVEYPYKDTKKNEIIFREFETACQQSSACSLKRGIESLQCVRECISPGCYATIYKHDEVALFNVPKIELNEVTVVVGDCRSHSYISLYVRRKRNLSDRSKKFFMNILLLPKKKYFNMSSHGAASVTAVGVPVVLTENLNSPAYISWRKLQLSKAKLKASSKTSALLSGFAMVAMVEVNLNQDSKVPPAMLVAFTVCTTLLVGVHMLALMISTCILPNIDAVCSLNSVNLVHESPHERLHWYIETAWAFSTLLGLILFLFEIAILCWVKFYDISPVAAWSACAVLIPVLVVFVAFAVHFYQTMVAHKYEVSRYGIRELELLKEQIEVNDSSIAHSPTSTIEVTSNYSRTQII